MDQFVDNKLCLEARALTSFESGAGLCLAESELEIPSFNKLL